MKLPPFAPSSGCFHCLLSSGNTATHQMHMAALSFECSEEVNDLRPDFCGDRVIYRKSHKTVQRDRRKIRVTPVLAEIWFYIASCKLALYIRFSSLRCCNVRPRFYFGLHNM
jgi:hypothetical protein